MRLMVRIQLGAHSFLFAGREWRIAPTIGPAIPPSIPGWKCRMPAHTDAAVHQIRQRFVTGARQHTIPQRLVGTLSLGLGAAMPVRYIMRKATVTPGLSIGRQIVVGKQAATVTRKITELRTGHTATDSERHGQQPCSKHQCPIQCTAPPGPTRTGYGADDIPVNWSLELHAVSGPAECGPGSFAGCLFAPASGVVPLPGSETT